MIDDPGNMMLVTGDNEVKAWLRTEDHRVNDWLYELVDGLVVYADARIRELAPGSISELVELDPAHETATGAFEGVAGVVPAVTEKTLHVGLGSDPADFPVFVEVGTGIFGAVGHPISSMHPDHLIGLMGPIPYLGREIFVSSIKGQRPQRYAGRSFDDLVERTPVVIKGALPALGSRE